MAAKKSVKTAKTVSTKTTKTTKTTKSSLLVKIKELQEQVSNFESAARSQAESIIQKVSENDRLRRNNVALQNAVANEQEKSAKIINELQIEMLMNHLLNVAGTAAVKAITEQKNLVAELEQDNHHKQMQIDALKDKVLASLDAQPDTYFIYGQYQYHPPADQTNHQRDFKSTWF